MEKSGITHRTYSWLQLTLLYAMWLGFFLYMFRHAWVAEDAYITFRVIENFFAGHGLSWNIYERVQAYTHPLWMLLHFPLHALWHNIFFSSIVLSVVCSSAALLIVLITVKKPVWQTAIFFFIPLLLSKSFIDYTSSGLENPLSYLLYACFFYVILRQTEHRFFWFFSSLIIALALFNRMDVIWLYAPVMLYIAKRKGSIAWKQVATGFTPLAGWLLFSLIYYGFIFPNTKYAKLHTGMDYSLYFNQGLEYFKHLIVMDSAGAIILLSLTLFFIPSRFSRLKLSSSLPTLLAAGIILQIIYVILVGGDYMAGRFWALPIFAAVSLWFFALPSRWRADFIFALVCLFATAHIASGMLMDMRRNCKACVPLRGRVINAKFVFNHNALVVNPKTYHIRSEGHYPFAREGKKIRKQKKEVKKLHFIGMSAYYAGPSVKLIDEMGLADPLLARLPASKKQHFYISHFRRAIPRGYMHALRTGSLERLHPDLARYYRELRRIVSGEIWDTQRLKTIILFNLGYYDHWKKRYIHTQKKAAEVRSGKKK